MMTGDEATKLRAPFPRQQIGRLPRTTCKDCSRGSCTRHEKGRCNECQAWISSAHIHLDYVGHAEVTDRLLDVDPTWTWEPVAFDPDGLPKIAERSKTLELWMRMTVLGVTRIGVGTVPEGTFEAAKQLVSDGIRNCAMRFGVALDLWAKTDLHDRPLVEPADMLAPETITEAQVDQIKEAFSIISDAEERQTVMGAWRETWAKANGGIHVSQTPKHKFLEVIGSASAAAKAATDTPSDGVVQESKAASRAVSMDQIREWVAAHGVEGVSWTKGKDAALVQIAASTGVRPGDVVAEIITTHGGDES